MPLSYAESRPRQEVFADGHADIRAVVACAVEVAARRCVEAETLREREVAECRLRAVGAVDRLYAPKPGLFEPRHKSVEPRVVEPALRRVREYRYASCLAYQLDAFFCGYPFARNVSRAPAVEILGERVAYREGVAFVYQKLRDVRTRKNLAVRQRLCLFDADAQSELVELLENFDVSFASLLPYVFQTFFQITAPGAMR